ncbi:MAG: SUMF1/EgtB/PvdO family nonheme iron enzyme [Rhodospirillaceae bacterium]|nr:SUMF1/EgtB/PvdO family nonheme iron enzyme [Rhodospirillales bacterium]
MRLLWLCMAALLLVAGPSSSATQRRVALVIGMGQYVSVPNLPNPPKDARAIGESLARLGFEVDTHVDSDYRDFAKSLREFGIKAQNADVALIFYAGHGMQVDRENYLIPIDARLERERDLIYEAMPLDRLLGEASQARVLGIVILDACRNNPFAEKLAQKVQTARARAMSVGPGLARVDATPKDTLVALATRADALAEDGEGNHSPYAEALLANLEMQGLELGLFFRRVRDQVLKATHGRQEPFTFGSLGAEPFYFNPLPPNAPPVVPVLAPLDFSDDKTPKPLNIAGLSDPDGDRLSVRITGLPKGGALQLGDRVLLMGDALTAEQLGKLTFTPDGSYTGQAGPLTFAVEDGRGANVAGSLFIKIVAANRPPAVEPERQLHTVALPLGLRVPLDPDGDPLFITVSEVPGVGVVRKSDGAGLKVGDRVAPEELSKLTYDPGLAPQGEAGTFAYVVDDQRGGRAEARVRIAIGTRPAGGGGAPNVATTHEPAKATQTASVVTVPMAPPEPTKSVALPIVPAPSEDGTLRDCRDCPALVVMKPGSFTMGSMGGDASSKPPHKVTIAKPFALGKFEVTVAEWNACVQAGACKAAGEPGEGGDRLPVRNVHWQDAQDYVAWLTKQTGRKYRLPTEAEWEFAARGGADSAYWWGDVFGKGKANCSDCGGAYDRKLPSPVDAFPANGFGLFGTAGGVAEWVQDCWHPNYAGAPKDGAAREEPNCRERVIRGGSWRNDHSYAASASRFYYDGDVRYIANGFRVVREME